MPIDKWRKANDRAKYGPATRMERQDRKTRRAARRMLHNRVTTKSTTVADSEFSESFMVWFGKHKGRRIKDVPRSYLAWLVKAHTSGTSERMDALVSYLTVYLATT
jgi:hypothetical protein